MGENLCLKIKLPPSSFARSAFRVPRRARTMHLTAAALTVGVLAAENGQFDSRIGYSIDSRLRNSSE